MHIEAKRSSNKEILPLRARYRAEAKCQLVYDSVHRRNWAASYLLELNGRPVGFGSVAIDGPWKQKPTIFEFYLLSEHRSQAFDFFEAFLEAGQGRYFEVQSSEALLTVMLHVYGQQIASESIVFQDQLTTSLRLDGFSLRQATPDSEIVACIGERQGGGEWLLEKDGEVAAKGGILFHYNRPYGDIYMEVMEPFRGRGFGAYLVQEIKRECYRFGAIPAARCNTTNIASRRTLQKAGFAPYAHILNGLGGEMSPRKKAPDLPASQQRLG